MRDVTDIEITLPPELGMELLKVQKDEDDELFVVCRTPTGGVTRLNWDRLEKGAKAAGLTVQKAEMGPKGKKTMSKPLAQHADHQPTESLSDDNPDSKGKQTAQDAAVTNQQTATAHDREHGFKEKTQEEHDMEGSEEARLRQGEEHEKRQQDIKQRTQQPTRKADPALAAMFGNSGFGARMAGFNPFATQQTTQSATQPSTRQQVDPTAQADRAVESFLSRDAHSARMSGSVQKSAPASTRKADSGEHIYKFDEDSDPRPGAAQPVDGMVQAFLTMNRRLW